MVKPYYEDTAVTLYHGRCEDLLGSLDFDLVVTDPPFGMNFRSNRRIIKHEPITGDDAMPLDVIKQLILKAKNAAYVFWRWENLYEMPKPKSVLCWVKNNWSMGDLLHEHGRQWEACCFYPKGGHEFVKRIPDVIHADRTGNKRHPTEKPVSLLSTIIDANKGDVVFDPYCGSGSTLVAAKNLGRKAVGCEVAEDYCEIIANRLRQEVMAF